MMAGRRGHPTGRARLRSDSGRSRPRPQAVRSPTPALHRGAAAPRSQPTAHRHAGGEHHPIPGLDDMAERPEVPARSRLVQRLVQFLLEPDPVDLEQGRAHQLQSFRQVRAGHPFDHAHHPPRRPDRASFQECGRAFRTWCSAGRPARGPVLLRLGRRLGTAVSTHGTLPHRRAMPHPRCIAVLRRWFGVRVERDGAVHPFMASAAVGGPAWVLGYSLSVEQSDAEVGFCMRQTCTRSRRRLRRSRHVHPAG
jgi:hypothetical protein